MRNCVGSSFAANQSPSIIASVQGNLVMFKLKGWTDDDVMAFQTARDAFRPAVLFRTQSNGGAKDTTMPTNAASATLH